VRYECIRWRKISDWTANICAATHLLNPVASNVATRGNIDPVIGFLVLLTLWLLLHKYNIAAGLAYGLAVHMKIYPVIYGLAILLFLAGGKSWRYVISLLLSPK